MAPILETLAFALFALVTVGCALGTVLVRDVWHSALLLGGALLSVAVHYVMLQAEFLAAMQVLVYVGGVLVLVTFAVMLTRPVPGVESDADTEVGSP
jgi:NADH-quinone oxidoreductase subunit J